MHKQTWQNNMQKVFGANVIALDEPMKRQTYFRIGGPADALARPQNEHQLVDIVNWCLSNNIPYLVIGNGTNLLVLDKGVRGVVIKIDDNFAKIETNGNKITAQAGALLSSVAEEAWQHELAGFEFASGIPGSIGGALYMNAGAYEGEMKDVVYGASIVTKDGKVEDWDASRIALGYRSSAVAKEQAIVMSVTIELQPGQAEEIRAEMNKLNRWRRERQPLHMPSAGSTFKRPAGTAGSYLIDQAGLKGYTIGGAQVSPKHAGFIVNIGDATAQDVLELMAYVQDVVEDKFSIRLEPEVRIIGEE